MTFITLAAIAGSTAVSAAPPAATSGIPRGWTKAWANPPVTDRPLQIIHGIDPTGNTPAGMGQVVEGATRDEKVGAGMSIYRDLGLGGVVCNVAFNDYMRSEENWKTFVTGVQACRKLGLVIWIYDEAGYPSGAAGGLVLEAHPEYEAQELAYDPSQTDPFLIRPAFEHTHASNNYYATRRYINLIDDRATRLFIQKTHEEYKKRLGGTLSPTITAFFTDEPSLITVNLGPIPEEARKRVPVVDPTDPTVKLLPAVPWAYDLLDRYRERYHEDLIPVRRSLFEGDSEADRKVRTQYWALIADLVSQRYFGAIGAWCAANNVASSGHSLWEEAIMHHPTLEGNGIQALSQMQMPGMDLLTSNPENVFNGGWITAAMPSSAAMLSGRRRVMTEVSDFSEKMAHMGPASLKDMQATAAWQAAWGVTEFNLYYSPADRTKEDYQAYCAFVGRVNALLKPARQDPDILLYYPVHDLWAEYKPMANPLSLESQSARAQRIVRSFFRIGSALQNGQMPFSLTDHKFLAKASVHRNGTMTINNHTFRAIVIPDGTMLPQAAQAVVDRFRKAGGTVITDREAEPVTSATLAAAVRPAYSLDKPAPQITLGRFYRAGHPVLLVLNASATPWSGKLAHPSGFRFTQLDPATGAIADAKTDGSSSIALELEPRQTVLLVGNKR